MKSYHMKLQNKLKCKNKALEQFKHVVYSDKIQNFMILFGYPLTIYTENDKIYFETASKKIINLCKKHKNNKQIVYLGYFTDKCNYPTISLDAKIKSIKETNKFKVTINNQKPQILKEHRIELNPLQWTFGEFVGSTATNKNITENNFNVQLKHYYKGNNYKKTEFTASPCDNEGKEDIFLYKCKLINKLS